MPYYILDDTIVRIAKSTQEYEEFRNSFYKMNIVKQTEVEQYFIITISLNYITEEAFLKTDDSDELLFFETMVRFEGTSSSEIDGERHATYEQAIQYHNIMIDRYNKIVEVEKSTYLTHADFMCEQCKSPMHAPTREGQTIRENTERSYFIIESHPKLYKHLCGSCGFECWLDNVFPKTIKCFIGDIE
jgi:hypothetical protein